ncbi:MAG: alginate export family protein [Bacteroidota bacterium]
MKRFTFITRTLLVALSITSLSTMAQRVGGFQNERAIEDYSKLKDSTYLAWQNVIKYLSLDKQRNSYLSFGGSIRTRFEHVTHRFWMPDTVENYYSQRLAFHADIHFGKQFRFFGELQSGYKTQGEAFLQTDDIDVHQGFLAFKPNASNLSFRFGRQEMRLGTGRLVDFGLGPNVRRTFDMGKITYSDGDVNIQAYYGKEVQLGFRAFDNDFMFFQENAPNPMIWGIYSQFSAFPNEGEGTNTELYYLGIESGRAVYNDVAGREIRHSIGIRRFGKAGPRFTYNTELIYQFGDISTNAISAFNVETDWKYTLIHKKWRPSFGLKLDWSSGDSEPGDGKINSFNPMYVNPAIYSLAAVNTPVNLVSFHPTFTVFPTRKLMVQLEFATFNRSSKNDGLYSPPNRQTRMANGISDKHIGNTMGLFVVYTFSPYLSFNLRTSYFEIGNFLEETGPSESIFQFAPTLEVKF